MDKKVTVLNFDQGYRSQSFLQNDNYDWLDLDMIENTSLYCERNSLEQIAQMLKQRTRSNVTLLGGGNYHYVSYLLLAEIEQPFTLVLFDHHTDTLPSPSELVISCGSWVLESLQKLPMLEKVIMIGVGDDWEEQIPSSFKGKVTAFPKNNVPDTVVSIVKEIPTESVYISIDKDVLDPRDAATNWNHGTLRIGQLVDIAATIIADKVVLGIDVCGEYPINPGNPFNSQTREAVKKNERANRLILELLK